MNAFTILIPLGSEYVGIPIHLLSYGIVVCVLAIMALVFLKVTGHYDDVSDEIHSLYDAVKEFIDGLRGAQQ